VPVFVRTGISGVPARDVVRSDLIHRQQAPGLEVCHQVHGPQLTLK
jgi:hypothetical protein